MLLTFQPAGKHFPFSNGVRNFSFANPRQCLGIPGPSLSPLSVAEGTRLLPVLPTSANARLGHIFSDRLCAALTPVALWLSSPCQAALTRTRLLPSVPDQLLAPAFSLGRQERAQGPRGDRPNCSALRAEEDCCVVALARREIAQPPNFSPDGEISNTQLGYLMKTEMRSRYFGKSSSVFIVTIILVVHMLSVREVDW